MKQHAAIVIAALMITSIAFVVSTSNVSAVHEQTPEIDKTAVKGETSMVLTITIANAGPAAIENVRITVPSGFLNLAPTMKLFKDNEVTFDGGVTLPAGTLINVTTGSVDIPENTVIIIENGTPICWWPTGRTDYLDTKLIDNLWAKITNWIYDNAGAVTGPESDLTIDILGENAYIAEDFVGTVTTGTFTAKLLADTQVVWVDEGLFRLPENLLVRLVGQSIEFSWTTIDGKITLEDDREVDVIAPNFGGDSFGRAFTATSTAKTGTVYNVLAGENVFVKTNKIIVPTSAELTIGAGAAHLFENTEAIREEDTQVGATESENQPKDWMQNTVGDYIIEWKGTEENQIASGGSLAFPFAVTTPDTGTYTIYVRTEDTAGNVTVEEVTITVDATKPTVELAVSLEWAKAKTTVTITVTADEPLAKLENVMVAENETTENVQVAMAPNADKTVWTGTYTTTDNENRDGLAKVWVIGEQLEDLFGNEGSNENATFYVDKLKPPTPDVMSLIYGWDVPTKYTNIGEWLIEGTAEDNYLGSSSFPEGMTVKVRVGTTTYDLTSGAGGYFYKSITLTEGTQEIGIQYIDPAGNVGAENAEDITYDATKPSVSITSPENGAIINDSTPTIKLTISDAVMGIENKDLYNENFGYSVRLCYDNGDLYGEDNLTPKTDPTEDPIKSFVFENDYPTELPENWYRIYVVAGDNLQQENVYFRFEVDITAPSAPGVPVGSVLEFTTAVKPYVTREPSVSISGEGDSGDTVNIYLDDETTPTKTAKVAPAGTWSAKISLTGGHVTKISVSETDVAGNESAKQVWGYVMADATAPAVTLATLPETTDKASVILSGTVKKDSWEEWMDITLTVQLGTGQVTVPITSVSGNDGSYSYSLSLAEGANTIVVQAIDGAGNASTVAHATVERTVTPWSIYAIVLVILALILAAIAIFAGPKIWKR